MHLNFRDIQERAPYCGIITKGAYILKGYYSLHSNFTVSIIDVV